MKKFSENVSAPLFCNLANIKVAPIIPNIENGKSQLYTSEMIELSFSKAITAVIKTKIIIQINEAIA